MEVCVVSNFCILYVIQGFGQNEGLDDEVIDSTESYVELDILDMPRSPTNDSSSVAIEGGPKWNGRDNVADVNIT